MPPRPTVIGIFFLLISISSFLLLLRPLLGTLHDYSSAFFGPCRPLSARLAEEEARYTVFLHDRLELIEKWGPKADAVDP